MPKRLLVLLSALVAAALTMFAPVGASARARHHSCCGGPVAPSYVYRTVHPVSHITRYRDTARTRYVTRLHRVYHVTEVRPLLYVHTVNRVHYHTVSRIHTVYGRLTHHFPARVYHSFSTERFYDCGCGPQY